MMHLNLLEGRKVGCWSRIMARARGPLPPAMFAAYAAMRSEQTRDGERRGHCKCDIPWCSRVATGRWVRTAAEVKASRVKYKGSVGQMEPQSVRCETHIPDWRLVQYVALTGLAHMEACA